MYNLNKFKPLVSIVLSITIIFTSVFLNATPAAPVPPAKHKETIVQFINQIKEAQDQSFDIAQHMLKDSVDSDKLQSQINAISNPLQVLNKSIEDYASLVQGLNEQDRQVRLTFNFINLVSSNLYTLSALAHTQNDVERIQLLDEFFRTRLNAVDILSILESLLAKYNP